MNSHPKLTSSQRFNDYLNSLQEVFKSDATSMTTANAHRFNIYLGKLRGEFELMALEIETIGRERDEYKAKVENGCPNICDRCNNEIASASQIGVPSGATSTKNTLSLFRKPFFQFKSRDKPSTSRRLDQIQESRPVQKPRSIMSPTSQSVSHSRPSDSTLLSQERKWSITYNTDVEKELDVELAHEFSHKSIIGHLKFSKDGKRLAVGCGDGKVYIYDVATGILTHVLGNLLREDERISGALCFSGDGKYLATSAFNGHTYIWEIKMKYLRKAFKGHLSYSWSLEFSPNGRLLVSASCDNTVRLWNTRDGSSKPLTEPHPTFIDGPYYRGADFNPHGKSVAALHRDGIVRIWDVRTGRLMRRVMSHSFGLGGIKFMPDGKGLVTGGENRKGGDATLKSWDISSLNATRLHAGVETTNGLGGHVSGVEEQTKPERIFSGHEHTITSLAVSHDGVWIASGSWDRSVRIWNTRNAAMQCTLNNAQDGWIFVDFSPAGVHLASGADDGLVRIWKYTYATCGDSQVRIGH